MSKPLKSTCVRSLFAETIPCVDFMTVIPFRCVAIREECIVTVNWTAHYEHISHGSDRGGCIGHGSLQPTRYNTLDIQSSMHDVQGTTIRIVFSFTARLTLNCSRTFQNSMLVVRCSPSSPLDDVSCSFDAGVQRTCTPNAYVKATLF